jgi:hypothetical protein
MGCMGAALLGTPAARADGGLITFSGAIVENTCAGGPDLQTSAPSKPQRLDCARTPANPTQQGYTALRVALSGGESDKVLKYFHDYMVATRADAAPTMVVRTYE